MNAPLLAAQVAMPARPPKGVARHAWKYKAPTERRDRSRVAWIAGIAFLFFMGCAVAGTMTRQTYVPVKFGSTIWIELALEYFPRAWFLGPLHNLVLASVAAGFFCMVTTAHVDIPGDPRQDSTVLWRRQARFAYPALGGSVLLAASGIALQLLDHSVLAVLLESPAVGIALAASAHLWVPIARTFVVVEFKPYENDGMGNRIVVGGLRHMVVIFQDHLIGAHVRTSPWEYVLGMASLVVVYRDHAGQARSIRVRALGSAKLMLDLAYFLNGDFRIARSLDAASTSPYGLSRPAPPPARGPQPSARGGHPPQI